MHETQTQRPRSEAARTDRGACLSVRRTSALQPVRVPSSARLESLFSTKGITRLGDLDGCPWRNCITRELRSENITELVLLKRVAAERLCCARDCLAPAVSPVFAQADETIADLTARERKSCCCDGRGQRRRAWTLQEGWRQVSPHAGTRAADHGVDFALRSQAGGRGWLRSCEPSLPPARRRLPAHASTFVTVGAGRQSARALPLPVYVHLLGELHPKSPPGRRQDTAQISARTAGVALRALRNILQEGECDCR